VDIHQTITNTILVIIAQMNQIAMVHHITATNTMMTPIITMETPTLHITEKTNSAMATILQIVGTSIKAPN
jgi:hypothetical protein